MADYIEREAAVKIAERYGLTHGSVLGRHSGIADCIASEIEGIPTADVVEVVLCKDCEYWGDESGRIRAPDGSLCDRCKAHSYLVGGRYIGLFPKENDFCSSGKRRYEGCD